MRAGLPLQPRAHALHRNLRRLLARGLPADAIHHQEDAALRVHVERVLVVAPHAAGVARPRAPDLGLNHSMCFGTPGKTTPARPMRARAGTGVSRLRSRFSPPSISMLHGAFSPSIVVPSWLRSFRKNCPLAGSRRRRKCSRETSGSVSSLMSVQ